MFRFFYFIFSCLIELETMFFLLFSFQSEFKWITTSFGFWRRWYVISHGGSYFGFNRQSFSGRGYSLFYLRKGILLLSWEHEHFASPWTAVTRLCICIYIWKCVCVCVPIFLFWLIKNAPVKLDEFPSRAKAASSRVLKTPTSSVGCSLNLHYPPRTISFQVAALLFPNHISIIHVPIPRTISFYSTLKLYFSLQFTSNIEIFKKAKCHNKLKEGNSSYVHCTL